MLIFLKKEKKGIRTTAKFSKTKQSKNILNHHLNIRLFALAFINTHMYLYHKFDHVLWGERNSGYVNKQMQKLT